jgi:hypothetical protein
MVLVEAVAPLATSVTVTVWLTGVLSVTEKVWEPASAWVNV